jgi:hypothetical protein
MPFDDTKDVHTALEISTRVNDQCKIVCKGDACIIWGTDMHVIFNSMQVTNLQGSTFQVSDEHAVHIQYRELYSPFM